MAFPEYRTRVKGQWKYESADVMSSAHKNRNDPADVMSSAHKNRNDPGLYSPEPPPPPAQMVATRSFHTLSTKFSFETFFKQQQTTLSAYHQRRIQ